MNLVYLGKDKNTLRYALKHKDKFIGEGGIRLKTTGAGDVVYKIYENERGKGFGNLILKLLIDEAKKSGKKELILVCRKNNLASKKIIENNGGIYLQEIKRVNKENRLKYLIKV